MKIGITFAAYNNISYTIKCLNSIFNNKGKFEKHVVVVDNGSQDGTLQKIKNAYPQVKVIRNAKNTGCSFAWNQGLNDCLKSGCDFLILTQNDVIISEDTISNTISFFEKNPRVQIVSPYVINVPHNYKIDFSQEQIDRFYEKLLEEYGDSRNSSFCFYFFAMRKEVFEKFKFDEEFKKVLYEDSDFYNKIMLNQIPTCHSLKIGIAYHRYNTTQIIAKNSNPLGNKVIFERKWKGREQEVENGMKESMKGIDYTNKCPLKSTFIDINHEKIKEIIQ